VEEAMPTAAFHANAVIITGASSGIGRALALELASEGAWLALAARDAERLQAVAVECRQHHACRVITVPTDVSDEPQCRNLADCAVQEFGRLDTLINNAAISMWARFEEMQTLAPFEEIMRVNYLGSVYCTYHALPHLKRSRGRLVAVSSLAGRNGVPTRSGYAGSKHAMVGFFDSLRIELAGSGVTVTVVYPDFVTSEIRERAYGADGRPLGRSPVREAEVMSAEECARRIAKAAGKRKRELLMGRGPIGIWLKMLAPTLADNIARKAIAQGK
jgi:short-subunit dehydrogenase